MKAMKKTLAILLALVMVAALSVSAFAAGIDASNVQAGETYTVYKLLEYTSDTTKTPAAYTYFLNKGSEDLKAVLEDVGFKFSTSADGSRYTVTNAGDLNDVTLVANLKKADLSKALFTESKTASEDGQVIWDNLDAGYYFVTTTTGSLCTLKTYTDQALILDKHEDTTVDKEASVANASVGDTVTFTVTVNAKKGETVTLTDTLGTGLTLDAQTALKVTGSTYEVKKWETTKDASNLEILFAEAKEDTTITVTYTATINDSAISKDEVKNTATVSWGHQTATDSATVKLFKFDIQKVDQANAPLDGVKFTLTNAAGKYYDGQSVWTDKETVLTTDKDGKIAVKGIAAGIYTLTEVETKAGYNLLDKPVVVTVDDKGDVTVQNATNAGNVVTVVNTAGSELPSTGGIGTTIFYILGSILVIGAGVVLASKRRVAE